MTVPVPGWADQVKAQIAKRYGQIAEAADFQGDASARARDAGYPAHWVARLAPSAAARYSGCGFALEDVDLSGVRIAVDLGCGAGLDALLLSQRLETGGLVLALDLAPEMLVRLREAAANEGTTPVLAVAGDMEQLPFKDGVADLVLANASINLTVDKRAAFAEAARILRPGGRLVARDLAHEGPLPTDLALDPVAWNTSLGGVVSEPELRDAARAAGLADIRISHRRPFPPVTAVRLEAIKPC
jgi:SAM-dependent methyltransferase